jgi:hypothetical protein
MLFVSLGLAAALALGVNLLLQSLKTQPKSSQADPAANSTMCIAITIMG